MTDPTGALRQQLQQLQDLRDSGALTDEAHAAARAPLERALAERLAAHDPPADLAPAAGSEASTPRASAGAASPSPPASTTPLPADTAPPPRPSRALWATVTAGVLLLAAVGYGVKGTPGALVGRGPATEAPAADGNVTPEQIDAMVAQLAEHLKQKPDDAAGWTMLGRAYAAMGRHAEAVPALEKALALSGESAGLLADLADSLASQAGGRLAGRPAELVQRALALEPTHLKSLALSGSAAFDAGDYATAARQWEQVERALPPDSAFLGQVRQSIAQARQAAGAAAPGASASAPPAMATAAANAPTPAAAAGPRLTGRVTLAAGLAARAAPDDTVFVYARPAEGPRMPLAILRKQVRDLPLSFALDDSMAMSPQARLSGQQRVVVVARISKSGNAMPQPGDLIGQSAPLPPDAAAIAVEIGEVVER